MMEGMDLSACLRPGVYILRLRGRVVWIGAARKPLVRIYAHSVQRRGDKLADFLPSRPVEFDAVEVRPCSINDLDREEQRLRDELGWAPPVPRVSAHPTDWQRLCANA